MRKTVLSKNYNNKFLQLVGNNAIPDIDSEKWIRILSEIIVDYSNAKSQSKIVELNKIFNAVFSGKIASNILFLESIYNILKKSDVLSDKAAKKIQKIFEKIVYQMASMFSSQKNLQYITQKLGRSHYFNNKNTQVHLTLQGVREKINHKLEMNELKLFDPNGRMITDYDEVKNILEKINIAIGIPSYAEGKNIFNPTRKMFLGLAKYFNKENVTLLGNFYHEVIGNTADAFINEIQRLITKYGRTNIYTLVMSTGFDKRGNPIKGKGNNFRNFFELLWLAKNKGVFKGGAVVDADLMTFTNNGKEVGVTKLWVKYLLYPLIYPEKFGLKHAAEFVSPIYARHTYDGTVTNNICVPIIKLVSNMYIRQPIGGEFGFSAKALEKFLFSMEWNDETQQYGIDIAMSLTAVINKLNIVEVELGAKIHNPPSEGKLFNVVLEICRTVVKLLVNKRGCLSIKKDNRKIVCIRQRQEVPLQNWDLDYGYYKKIFYDFFGGFSQNMDLGKDLLTKNQILKRAKKWGLKKICMEL